MVDLEKIKDALGTRNRISTHWDGCETDPRHRDCAMWLLIAEVERLRAERDELIRERFDTIGSLHAE